MTEEELRKIPTLHFYRTDWGDVLLGPEVLRYAESIDKDWQKLWTGKSRRRGAAAERAKERLRELGITLKTAALIALVNDKQLDRTA